MRRALVALATVALALTMAACEPEGTGSDRPKPKPPAGGPKHQNPGGEAAQPAPVQGDPGAHNTQEGEVDLHVEWASENRKKPACEWGKNAPGQGHPCEGLREAVQEEKGQDYFGLWEREERGKSGDVFHISAQGNVGTKWITCTIFWKGVEEEGVTVGNRCSVTLTLE